MNKKPLIFFIFTLLGFFHADLDARQFYRVIKKEKDFYKIMRNSSFVVALFMSLDKHSPHNNAQLQQRSDFSYVSSKRVYAQGDVSFVIVDTDRAALDAIIQRYNISQAPIILLFDSETLLKNKEGKVVALKGFVHDKAIDSFIDDYLGDSIERYIERKAQIREEMRERYEAEQEYNRPSIYYGIGFGGGGGCGGFAGNGFPACDYSWPYNTGYGYNCGNWGYYGGYPMVNFGMNIPL